MTDTKRLKNLQMSILEIFGAEDDGILPKTVREFESALNNVGVTNSIHIYEGAGHAFANPSGTRYNKEAAKDAWQKTTKFLEENLKQNDGRIGFSVKDARIFVNEIRSKRIR